VKTVYKSSLLSKKSGMATSEKHPRDSTVAKVQSHTSPHGKMGQKYLVCGKSIEMRLWEELKPEKDKEEKIREYETVGYVLKGKAELHLEGQLILLNPGDSWFFFDPFWFLIVFRLVPPGASHKYTILEDFTAVEATHPPASIHGRDE
jgi:hypothetical protein